MKPTVSQFGQMLRRYRESYENGHGISQWRLSRELSIPHSTVNRWERTQRTPDRPTVIKIARALNLTLDETRSLLAAAGYPFSMSAEGLDLGRAAVRELAALNPDDALSQRDIDLLDEAVLKLVGVWRQKGASPPNPADLVGLLGDLGYLAERLRGHLCQLVGAAYEGSGAHLEAQHWYERARLAAKTIGDKQLQAELHISLGDSLRNQSRRKALDEYYSAIAVCGTVDTPSSNDRLTAIRARRKAASVYLLTWTAARPQEPGEQDDLTRAASLLDDCITETRQLLEQGRLDGALQRQTKQQLCRALYYRGWTYSLAGDPNQGIAVRKEGLAIADQLKDTSLLALGYRLLGDGYDNDGRLADAVESYALALEQCNLLPNDRTSTREHANILRGQASTLLKQGRHDEAQQKLQESLDLLKDQRDYLRTGMAVKLMAKLHLAEGDLENAQLAYLQAISLFECIPNEYYVSVARLRRAEVLYKQGQMLDGEHRERLLEEARQVAHMVSQVAGDSTNVRLTVLSALVVAHMALLNGDDLPALRNAYGAFCRVAVPAKALPEHGEEVLTHLGELADRGEYEKVIGLSDFLLLNLPDDISTLALRRQLDERRQTAGQMSALVSRPMPA